jgi:hypothetical protein
MKFHTAPSLMGPPKYKNVAKRNRVTYIEEEI